MAIDFPNAWETDFVGTKTWLEYMNAELIHVTNSKITCKGGDGPDGGNMIDYVILSNCFIPFLKKKILPQKKKFFFYLFFMQLFSADAMVFSKKILNFFLTPKK